MFRIHTLHLVPNTSGTSHRPGPCSYELILKSRLSRLVRLSNNICSFFKAVRYPSPRGALVDPPERVKLMGKELVSGGWVYGAPGLCSRRTTRRLDPAETLYVAEQPEHTTAIITACTIDDTSAGGKDVSA